jgi:hypothetical protein
MIEWVTRMHLREHKIIQALRNATLRDHYPLPNPSFPVIANRILDGLDVILVLIAALRYEPGSLCVGGTETAWSRIFDDYDDGEPDRSTLPSTETQRLY